MENQEAHNDQPGHIIERGGDATPFYLSEKLGRDYGQPVGAWTAEREQATAFTEEKAKQLLGGPLQDVAHNCKVVPK